MEQEAAFFPLAAWEEHLFTREWQLNKEVSPIFTLNFKRKHTLWFPTHTYSKCRLGRPKTVSLLVENEKGDFFKFKLFLAEKMKNRNIVDFFAVFNDIKSVI